MAGFAHAAPLPGASDLYVPGRCSRSLLALRRSGFPAFVRRSTTVDNLPDRRRTVRLYDREPGRDRQWWNAANDGRAKRQPARLQTRLMLR